MNSLNSKRRLTLSAVKEPFVRIASWTLLAAFAVAPIAAQVSLPNLGGRTAAPAPISIANHPDPVVGAVVSAVMPGFPGRGLVKGAPFSATQTTVHEQTLADGTIIKSTVEVRLGRDAEGRMRAEGTLKSSAAAQGRIVSVWNPVDRTAISWISGNPSANFATGSRRGCGARDEAMRPDPV